MKRRYIIAIVSICYALSTLLYATLSFAESTEDGYAQISVVMCAVDAFAANAEEEDSRLTLQKAIEAFLWTAAADSFSPTVFACTANNDSIILLQPFSSQPFQISWEDMPVITNIDSRRQIFRRTAQSIVPYTAEGSKVIFLMGRTTDMNPPDSEAFHLLADRELYFLDVMGLIQPTAESTFEDRISALLLTPLNLMKKESDDPHFAHYGTNVWFSNETEDTKSYDALLEAMLSVLYPSSQKIGGEANSQGDMLLSVPSSLLLQELIVLRSTSDTVILTSPSGEVFTFTADAINTGETTPKADISTDEHSVSGDNVADETVAATTNSNIVLSHAIQFENDYIFLISLQMNESGEWTLHADTGQLSNVVLYGELSLPQSISNIATISATQYAKGALHFSADTENPLVHDYLMLADARFALRVLQEDGTVLNKCIADAAHNISCLFSEAGEYQLYFMMERDGVVEYRNDPIPITIVNGEPTLAESMKDVGFSTDVYWDTLPDQTYLIPYDDWFTDPDPTDTLHYCTSIGNHLGAIADVTIDDETHNLLIAFHDDAGEGKDQLILTACDDDGDQAQVIITLKWQSMRSAIAALSITPEAIAKQDLETPLSTEGYEKGKSIILKAVVPETDDQIIDFIKESRAYFVLKKEAVATEEFDDKQIFPAVYHEDNGMLIADNVILPTNGGEYICSLQLENPEDEVAFNGFMSEQDNVLKIKISLIAPVVKDGWEHKQETLYTTSLNETTFSIPKDMFTDQDGDYLTYTFYADSCLTELQENDSTINIGLQKSGYTEMLSLAQEQLRNKTIMFSFYGYGSYTINIAAKDLDGNIATTVIHIDVMNTFLHVLIIIGKVLACCFALFIIVVSGLYGIKSSYRSLGVKLIVRCPNYRAATASIPFAVWRKSGISATVFIPLLKILITDDTYAMLRGIRITPKRNGLQVKWDRRYDYALQSATDIRIILMPMQSVSYTGVDGSSIKLICVDFNSESDNQDKLNATI